MIFRYYARHVLNVTDADHGESSPQAQTLLISQLSCSLFGQREQITITDNTLASYVYGRQTIEENYRCNYGLNPDYRPLVENSDLQITGVDRENQIRIIELPDHPYFIATLFLPQLNSTADTPHPLVIRLLAVTRKPILSP